MSTGLLCLPNEILVEILTYARPNGFEPLMLVCKRVFLAGQHLIESHNTAKRWVTGPLTEYPKHDMRSLLARSCNVDALFTDLPDAACKLQRWIPEYCSNVTLSFHLSLFEQYDDLGDFLLRLRSKLPWLVSSLEETTNRHTILKEMFESYNKIFSDPSIYQEYPNPMDPDFDFDSAPMEAIREEEIFFDADNFCKTAVLLCLPNLKEISEIWRGYMDGTSLDLHLICDVLLQIISADTGQTSFQQLEMIVLESGTNCGLLDMCAFTILPKLRCLRLVGFEPRTWSPLKNRDPEMHARILSYRQKSPLDRLVLLSASFNPSHLAQFLERIQGLASLTIQFIVPYKFIDWREKYDTTRATVEYQDRPAQTFVRDYDRQPTEAAQAERYAQYCGYHDAVKLPEILAAILEHHHGSNKSLRQLSLSLTPVNGNPQIGPGDLISNLKGFVGLTHLEIHNAFLQRLVSGVGGDSGSYEHRSLHEILPTSIQVVRMVLETKASRVLNSLLKPIAGHREVVPLLALIHLQLPKDWLYLSSSWYSNDPRQEELLCIEPHCLSALREELQRVGIRLVTMYYDKPWEVTPTEVWNTNDGLSPNH